MLNEEGLDHVFKRAAFLTDCGRQTVDTDRSTLKLFDDGGEQLAIEHVESDRIDLEQVERCNGQRRRNGSVTLDLRVIAGASQQTVGDARRSA